MLLTPTGVMPKKGRSMDDFSNEQQLITNISAYSFVYLETGGSGIICEIKVVNLVCQSFAITEMH